MAIKNKRLKFLRGSTYTLDVSDPALATNPLKFTADSGATEYTSGITLTGTQGQSGASIEFVVPSDAPNNLNYYGDSGDLKMGNHVLIPGDITVPPSPQDPYVLETTVENPNPFGTTAYDVFGLSVAMTSTHIIAGAPQEDETGTDGASSGKAYIYDGDGSNLLYTLDNENTYGTPYIDNFGRDVGLSTSYAIVGADNDEISSQYRPGVAYIYNLSDGSKRATLSNPLATDGNNLSRDQYFGYAVDINESYAIVGAWNQTRNNQSGSGGAYVFDTNGSLQYTFNNPAASTTTRFGWDVSMSDNYAAVTQRGSSASQGNVYIYDVQNSFNQLYTLTNPNSGYDFFGEGVAVSNTHAIVAAPYTDSGGTNDVGKAYIYDLSDGSLLHTLSNPGTGNYFAYGGAVAIDSDHAMVGAIYEAGYGKAYVYNISDGSLKSTIDNPTGQSNSYFGYHLDIAGKKFVVGNDGYNDSAGNTDAGRLYVYKDPTPGDYEPQALNQTFFLNAIKAYDSDVGVNTYSNNSSNLSGNFNDPESMATNGKYTLLSDANIALNHSGPGSTGNTIIAGSGGWTWLIRNSDGVLMKSWNGLIKDYDHNLLDLETYYIGSGGGTPYYSKYHTMNWGKQVAMNDNYMFIGCGYRPTGGSNTSLNWSDDRAFIFVYDIEPPHTLRKVWKLEDFASTSFPHSSSVGYTGGGSGFLEQNFTLTNDELFVPVAYSYYYGTTTIGGRVGFWDISDPDPDNWSTSPDAVIQNPINVSSNPIYYNWNNTGSNYSNKNFGQQGAAYGHNRLVVGHGVYMHTFTRSGNSFSHNTDVVVGPYRTYSYEPYSKFTNDSASPRLLNFGYGTAGSSTTREIRLLDPSNSLSADWTVNLKAVTGHGYPWSARLLTVGKDVKVELFHYGDGYTNAKAGSVRFLKLSDQSEVLTLDNPFTRDSDGLYFGDNYGIGHIDSTGSNKYSIVSWGEPDDVDAQDIITFNILEWDSDAGTLQIEGYVTPRDVVWGGNRALRAGRRGSGIAGNALNLDYWDITTTGNASDFGDCQGGTATSADHSASNGDRAIVSRNANNNNTYDYFSIPVPGNSSTMGNALETARSGAGIGDGTYAIFAGGYINGGPTGTGYRNDINYFTIATTGNAQDFGNLRYVIGFSGGAGNASRGTIWGGQAYNGSTYYYEDEIQYIPLGGVSGNASDFGDMSSGAYRVCAASDKTRAVAHLGNAGPNFSGSAPTNKLEYVTVDTTGNSTDFGDISGANANALVRSAACENDTRICFSGGETTDANGIVNQFTNEIQYITTQTTGNATDFGDLLTGIDQGFSSSGNAA